MTLDLIGAVIGLIYIWQEYKASPWLWITGVIMPVVYMFVYLEAGLYADFGMQVYYTGAAVYGLLVWKFGRKKGQTAARTCPSRGSGAACCCPPCCSSSSPGP